jgi:hypothetical protein
MPKRKKRPKREAKSDRSLSKRRKPTRALLVGTDEVDLI